MTRPSLAATVALMTGRRSNLRIDPDRPVPPELIEQLCRAAVAAPNHKMTEPWRFAVLTGAARTTLGEIAVEARRAKGATDPKGLAKTRAKYLRAPVVLVVGCAPNDDPILAAEDRDAVAAGIQNLLLAATAAGLASFWATGVAARHPAAVELCEFEAGTQILGLIYLGWPVAPAPTRGRSDPVIRWIGDRPVDTSL